MTQGPVALGLSQARGQPPRKCQPSAFFHTRLREKGSNGRRPHDRSGPRPGPVSRPPLAPQAVRAWQSLWPCSSC